MQSFPLAPVSFCASPDLIFLRDAFNEQILHKKWAAKQIIAFGILQECSPPFLLGLPGKLKRMAYCSLGFAWKHAKPLRQIS